MTSLLLLAALTVYRCGNTYQDFPCPGATVVDITWTPATDEDKRAADMLRLRAESYVPPYTGPVYVRPTHHRGWRR